MGGLSWRGIGVSAALLAAPFACGARATDDLSHASGGGHGGTDASDASVQAGAGGNTTAVGGNATAGVAGAMRVDSGSAAAMAGGAGQAGETCDAECLHSVVNQKSDFGTAWETSWFLLGCKTKSGMDCISIAMCPNQGAPVFEDRGAQTLETFPVGGVVGQHYKVTFKFNAIAGGNVYEGGTRDQGDQVPLNMVYKTPSDVTPLDAFYRDGSPRPSNYEVWKLSVFDETGKEARHYYMNAFPTAIDPSMSFSGHQTYLLSYTKSIVVIGGGKIVHRMADSNCHAADNCGEHAIFTTCDAPRNLPNEPADLPLPAMYQDPEDHQLKPTLQLSSLNTALSQPWHAQLGHLSVLSVEVTAVPATHDYL